MKLTKYDISRLIQALDIAIESEREYLDCHLTAWDSRCKQPRRCVPLEYQPVVQKTKRTIHAFHKLINKLRAAEAGGKG